MTGQFRLGGTVGSTNGVDPADSRAINQALLRLGFLDGARRVPARSSTARP